MKFKQIPKTTSDSKQKVLVMDDDAHFRMNVLLMLEDCGYEAHLTRNGREAIDLYQNAKQSTQPFDIVILGLDAVNLHGMGGEKTMRILLDIDPEVRAVVSSGDIHHPAITDYGKYGFCGALPKPFTMQDLHRVLSHTERT